MGLKQGLSREMTEACYEVERARSEAWFEIAEDRRKRAHELQIALGSMGADFDALGELCEDTSNFLTALINEIAKTYGYRAATKLMLDARRTADERQHS